MRLSLGPKITICFIPVVIIPATMSFFASHSVKQGKDNVTILSNEYISEVEVGAELRGAVNRAMYQMRGFGLSGQDSYLTAARQELALLDDALSKGELLGKEATHLKSLQDSLLSLTQSANHYHTLVNETTSTNDRAKLIRSEMDQAAIAFNTTAEKFIDGQYTAFDTDLDDRLQKLDTAKKLPSSANQHELPISKPK